MALCEDSSMLTTFPAVKRKLQGISMRKENTNQQIPEVPW
jgi:hypothetical protein